MNRTPGPWAPSDATPAPAPKPRRPRRAASQPSVRHDSGPIDRDSSLLAFQRRVLEEARRRDTPLLERAKFLAIVATNLDEVIMSRGAALRPAGDPHGSHNAAAANRWRALLTGAHRLIREADVLWHRQVRPLLAAAGVVFTDDDDLTPSQRACVDRLFTTTVLPVLAPLVWAPREPMPHVPNLGLNLLVELAHTDGTTDLVFVRVPDSVPPWLTAEDGTPAPARVWVDQVLRRNLPQVFGAARIIRVHSFRVIRGSQITLDEAHTGPMAQRMLDAVRRREQNPAVMLTVDRTMPPALAARLSRGLGLSQAGIVRTRAVTDMRRWWSLVRIERPDLHHPPLRSGRPAAADTPIFETIRRGELLTHQPFESYAPVLRLFEEAARDPDVVAVSATLYRTDRDTSPMVDALTAAALAGKQVRVVVELTARFDERRNVAWAERLRAAGAHVVHGLGGLKVHGKLALVVRREGARLRHYVHVSSGNYNRFTSSIYTDIGLLTCDEAIGADAADLFNALTGHAAHGSYRKLLVSPWTLRDALSRMVAREVTWAKRGARAHIILKMNALVDRDTIRLLEDASTAGVRIDLIVRGICCLRPGVPGRSERIHVRSIVGRFLEHSRAWYFRNGGAHEAYIGSADLRTRNLDRRVEVMVPVGTAALVARIRDEILGTCLRDNVGARELGSDGLYRLPARAAGEPDCSSQAVLFDVPHHRVAA